MGFNSAFKGLINMKSSATNDRSDGQIVYQNKY
jgi:hypothetical protein